MSKINKTQLIELGFIEIDKTEYLLDSDYLLNIITNELFFVNDGYGEPELVAKIENYEHLIQVLESINVI